MAVVHIPTKVLTLLAPIKDFLRLLDPLLLSDTVKLSDNIEAFSEWMIKKDKKAALVESLTLNKLDNKKIVVALNTPDTVINIYSFTTGVIKEQLSANSFNPDIITDFTFGSLSTSFTIVDAYKNDLAKIAEVQEKIDRAITIIGKNTQCVLSKVLRTNSAFNDGMINTVFSNLDANSAYSVEFSTFSNTILESLRDRRIVESPFAYPDELYLPSSSFVNKYQQGIAISLLDNDLITTRIYAMRKVSKSNLVSIKSFIELSLDAMKPYEDSQFFKYTSTLTINNLLEVSNITLPGLTFTVYEPFLYNVNTHIIHGRILLTVIFPSQIADVGIHVNTIERIGDTDSFNITGFIYTNLGLLITDLSSIEYIKTSSASLLLSALSLQDYNSSHTHPGGIRSDLELITVDIDGPNTNAAAEVDYTGLAEVFNFTGPDNTSYEPSLVPPPDGGHLIVNNNGAGTLTYEGYTRTNTPQGYIDMSISATYIDGGSESLSFGLKLTAYEAYEIQYWTNEPIKTPSVSVYNTMFDESFTVFFSRRKGSISYMPKHIENDIDLQNAYDNRTYVLSNTETDIMSLPQSNFHSLPHNILWGMSENYPYISKKLFSTGSIDSEYSVSTAAGTKYILQRPRFVLGGALTSNSSSFLNGIQITIPPPADGAPAENYYVAFTYAPYVFHTYIIPQISFELFNNEEIPIIIYLINSKLEKIGECKFVLTLDLYSGLIGTVNYAKQVQIGNEDFEANLINLTNSIKLLDDNFFDNRGYSGFTPINTFATPEFLVNYIASVDANINQITPIAYIVYDGEL